MHIPAKLATNLPFSASFCCFFFNMRYLGLSGRKGKITKDRKAGTAFKPIKIGHNSWVPKKMKEIINPSYIIGYHLKLYFF